MFYRGTLHASVMMEKDPESLASPKRNKCIMSLTSSRSIAKEFAWPRGMGTIHRLCLAPGCKVLDMQYKYTWCQKRKGNVAAAGAHNCLVE